MHKLVKFDENSILTRDRMKIITWQNELININ